MKRYVYSRQDGRLLRVEEATPRCGEDFCDRCGDCLECCEDDPCIVGGPGDGEHYWVVYEDEKDDRDNS